MKLPVRIVTVILLTLSMLCIVIFGLSSAAISICKSGDALGDAFRLYSDRQASGLYEEELPKIANAMADYFAGKADTPQVNVQTLSGERAAYSEKELQHLADVKALFPLSSMMFLCGALFLLYPFIIKIIANKGKFAFGRDAMQCWLLSIAFAFLCIAGAALWCLVNFRGAFWTFHLLLFTNRLWLLNPQTDLLIQLMPNSLFIYFAKQLFMSRNVLLMLALFVSLLIVGIDVYKYCKNSLYKQS